MKTLLSGPRTIKGTNDMQTLLDRNVYIFHGRVQSVVTASQGNLETRWSLSHTKQYEKNRGAEGGAEGDLRQTLMHLAVFHSGIYCDVY